MRVGQQQAAPRHVARAPLVVGGVGLAKPDLGPGLASGRGQAALHVAAVVEDRALALLAVERLGLQRRPGPAVGVDLGLEARLDARLELGGDAAHHRAQVREPALDALERGQHGAVVDGDLEHG